MTRQQLQRLAVGTWPGVELELADHKGAQLHNSPEQLQHHTAEAAVAFELAVAARTGFESAVRIGSAAHMPVAAHIGSAAAHTPVAGTEFEFDHTAPEPGVAHRKLAVHTLLLPAAVHILLLLPAAVHTLLHHCYHHYRRLSHQHMDDWAPSE